MNTMSPAAKRAVIIDTDLAFGSPHADVDDVVALLLCLASDQFSVRAVLASGGNVPSERASAHIENVLTRTGNAHIPHSYSIARPFDPSLWVQMRWKNLEEEYLPPPPPDALNSAALLTKILLESDEPLDLITIGALSNVAIAYTHNPAIAQKIGRIYMMGGSQRMRGVGILSEFNIAVDPIAASIVFESGIPITMFGLDVTKKRRIYPKDIQPWNNSTMPFVKELHDAAVSFMKYRAKRDNYDEPYAFFHDAMPVLYCMYPHLFNIKKCTIRVDTDGEYTRGMTVIDFKERKGKKLCHEVALDVDADECLNVIIQDIVTYWGKVQ